MTKFIRRSSICTTLVVALFALGVAGCAGTTPDDAGANTSDDEDALSRKEARERQKSKGDHSTDYCEQYDFYGDGICDDWCPDPDPDCETADNSCQDDSDCGSDEFCAFPDNACTAGSEGGTCEQQPEFCTEQYAPVCGCDGKTYGNACKAKAAGVNVASEGECSGNGDYDPCANKTCGEQCTTCPPNDPNCVETSVVKYCQPDGTCEPTTPQCSTGGCTSDSDCAAYEYCAKTGQNACDASTTGTCENEPQYCTEQYDPVCGCDGNTYGNACKAESNGVNVAQEGACGTSSDCTSDSDCARGEFCYRQGSDACSASSTGTCTDQPQFCTEQYDPVCGCDGQTYGNACKAKSAGVNVAQEGTCD